MAAFLGSMIYIQVWDTNTTGGGNYNTKHIIESMMLTMHGGIENVLGLLGQESKGHSCMAP